MNYKLIQLNEHSDARGKLISLEVLKNIPFALKQMYFVYDTESNKYCGEHMIIAINGSSQFILEQEGEQIEIIMDHPNIALYVGKEIRCKLTTSSQNCKLLILYSGGNE
jgi:hypothetical protein